MTLPDEPIVKFFLKPDIWAIASVADCPEVTLRQWLILEVQMRQQPGRTRHFVGYSVHDYAGQVSSAIQQFDPQTMRGTTQSGRVYQLSGSPGWNSDAEHTWRRWKSICSAADEVDVTGSNTFGPEKEQ